MIWLIILFILLIVFVLVMLSPLEALSWWAGWLGDNPTRAADDILELIDNPDYVPQENVTQFVIFMTGIGGFSQEAFLPEEREFMDSLMASMPEIHLVDDVYPYGAVEKGLTDGRPFSRFWRYAVNSTGNRRIVRFSINLRNLMQVLVSADPRYGRIYAYGLANILLRALVRHRYPFGSGMPVTLIGYSGGGEMSVRSVELLNQILDAPIRVVSLAGVFSANPGLIEVDRLYHIYGDNDKVQRLGAIMFPGRWRIAVRSSWNRARAAGKVTLVQMGPFTHNGPGGYLDHETLTEDGQPYFDFTVDTITRLIRENPHVMQDTTA